MRAGFRTSKAGDRDQALEELRKRLRDFTPGWQEIMKAVARVPGAENLEKWEVLAVSRPRSL